MSLAARIISQHLSDEGLILPGERTGETRLE